MRPEILFPFFAPLEKLPGIGKKTALLCEKLCGPAIVDLLFHMPTGFIDRRLKTKIADAPQTGVVTIEVIVDRHYPPATRKSPYKIVCHDDTGVINVIFFHAYGNYPAQVLPVGEKRFISGKVERFGPGNAQIQMLHPDYIVSETELDKIPEIVCVHPLTAGLSGKILNKAVRIGIEKMPDLPDWQDPAMTKREGWPDFQSALKIIHCPQNEDDLKKIKAAKHRLA